MGTFPFGGGYFGLYALSGSGPSIILGEAAETILIPFDDRTIYAEDDRAILVQSFASNIEISDDRTIRIRST